MRLLHVTHQYPPAIGGSEKYIADLSQELAARGHSVDVFTGRSLDYHTWKSELDARAHLNEVRVYRFRCMRRTRFHWRVLDWSLSKYWQTRNRWYEPLILMAGGPICPGMFGALLLKLGRYDLVHLNCLVYSHVAYGYLAARWRGVPVVVTPHAHIAQEVTYGLGYQLGILHGAEHVIVDTAGERDFLLGRGLHPQRVTVASVGLRPEEYPARDQIACRKKLGLPEDAFVMLFLGRQVEYKGLGATLDAYAALRERLPQGSAHPVLLIAGPETDYSRRLFATRFPPNGTWPGVVNLGRVSDDGRLDALNACDCVVLPSVGEAFGIVFLEAWIVGKPVIGPRTVAASAIVEDGVDGWLVSPADSDAIAESLARWIESPLLAREMGKRGRKKVLSQYTCRHMTDTVESVYRRILEQKRDRT